MVSKPSEFRWFGMNSIVWDRFKIIKEQRIQQRARKINTERLVKIVKTKNSIFLKEECMRVGVVLIIIYVEDECVMNKKKQQKR